MLWRFHYDAMFVLGNLATRRRTNTMNVITAFVRHATTHKTSCMIMKIILAGTSICLLLYAPHVDGYEILCFVERRDSVLRQDLDQGMPLLETHNSQMANVSVDYGGSMDYYCNSRIGLIR